MSKQTLSECCAREVIKGHKHDPHPLGRGEYNGRGTYEAIDVCSSCGMECEHDEIYVCDECGVISDRRSDVCTQCEEMAARKEVCV